MKSLCEDKLCSTLKVDNSLEYLVLGDLHNTSKLKKMALDLIEKKLKFRWMTLDYKTQILGLVETYVRKLAIKMHK